MGKIVLAKAYNIPAGLPFSKTLAQYVLDHAVQSGKELPEYRLFLPTRRACRVLRDTFLSLKKGQPLLLPRMMPLGDVDEEELSLTMFGQDRVPFEMPPAISSLKRQLLLAQLIASAPDYVQGHDHALALAKALAQFIDEVIVEGADFQDLHHIVPEEFAQHWQITLDFLKIITQHWPEILKEQGLIDVADRRNQLMRGLTDLWQDNPPDYPVIVAGATGSLPAAACLMKVVSRIPFGEVIFPGLDQDLSTEAWNAIETSHPQYVLKKALLQMDLSREDVKLLPDAEHVQTRQKLASAMMLPAIATNEWKTFGTESNIDSLLHNLEYYSCKTQQDEAFLIAMIMREALEDREDVTALITPDRVLASRVKAICRRWAIDVDDSAGEKLSETAIGKFILLVLHFFETEYDPASLLALLKSSLCKMGYPSHERFIYISQLEQSYLRTDTYYGSYDVLLDEIHKEEKHEKLSLFLSHFFRTSIKECFD